MKQIFLVLVFSSIIGCSRTKEPITVKGERPASAETAITAESTLATKGKERIEHEVNCLFDTSTYKFTTEALRNYDKKLVFHWDKQSSRALVKLSSTDSLLLHIGGCDHFTYSATYITDAAKFSDREFLVQKAKWLAKNFFSNGFDDKYVFSIENNLYKLEASERPDFLYYTIIDTDTAETDHVFEGWTIEKAGGKTRLNLVGYQN